MPVYLFEIQTMHNPSPDHNFVVIRDVVSGKYVAPVPIVGAGLKDEPHYWPLQERPAPFMGRKWIRINLRRGLPNGKYEYGFAAKEGGLIGQSYVDWFGDETLPIEFKGTLVSEPMEVAK